MLGMLFNKQGFLMTNLPLFLIPFGLHFLFRRRIRERAEVIFVLAWAVGSWLLYGATSNNSSGFCCSIRWFVPLLAPMFVILLLIVREAPWTRPMLAVLSLGGGYLSLCMSIQGPWTNKLVPGFWFVQGLALMICGWIAFWQRAKKEPRSQVNDGQSRPFLPTVSTEAL